MGLPYARLRTTRNEPAGISRRLTSKTYQDYCARAWRCVPPCRVRPPRSRVATGRLLGHSRASIRVTSSHRWGVFPLGTGCCRSGMPSTDHCREILAVSALLPRGPQVTGSFRPAVPGSDPGRWNPCGNHPTGVAAEYASDHSPDSDVGERPSSPTRS
jgi:hypothetical protein